jgi:hypothetical protein
VTGDSATIVEIPFRSRTNQSWMFRWTDRTLASTRIILDSIGRKSFTLYPLACTQFDHDRRRRKRVSETSMRHKHRTGATAKIAGSSNMVKGETTSSGFRLSYAMNNFKRFEPFIAIARCRGSLKILCSNDNPRYRLPNTCQYQKN